MKEKAYYEKINIDNCPIFAKISLLELNLQLLREHASPMPMIYVFFLNICTTIIPSAAKWKFPNFHLNF